MKDESLEIAEFLLANGNNGTAAIEVALVLENRMRKLAKKNKIPPKKRDNIPSLNMRLANKGIYGKLIQDQIQRWNDLRNSAAHARLNEYDKRQVARFLAWTKGFLEKYPS